MALFHASDLVSATVWVKPSGKKPALRGIIKAVAEPFCSATISQVILYSIYIVRLDDGGIARVSGFNLSRIQSSLDNPPKPLMRSEDIDYASPGSSFYLP